MITIDARGLSCPEPLMMAEEAVRKNPADTIRILVSTSNAKENIERMASKKGRKVSVKILEDVAEYEITLE